MNILIIGNGFDLAHGLKTKYENFLDWAYENNEMGCYENFDLGDYWRHQQSKPDWKLLDEGYGRLKNDWDNYNDKFPSFFKTLFIRGIDSWIDLENNLAQCVKKLGEKNPIFDKVFNEFFIAKFEKYIAEIVNKAVAQPKLQVENADRVLSFNYSNTFERLYGERYDASTASKICYINGKASMDAGQPHIVLGCDYYNYDRKELSQFCKVYQRHSKNTDDKYKDWLQSGTMDEIFIVGHSLGKTDYDILRPFVTKKNSETTVYYHNDESKGELIHKMINMVGSEFMNQRRIKFQHIDGLNIESQFSYMIN